MIQDRIEACTYSDSDHKLVKMHIQMKWHKIFNKQSTKSAKIDLNQLIIEKNQFKYQQLIKEKCIEQTIPEQPQEAWDKLVQILKISGEKYAEKRKPTRNTQTNNWKICQKLAKNSERI